MVKASWLTGTVGSQEDWDKAGVAKGALVRVIGKDGRTNFGVVSDVSLADDIIVIHALRMQTTVLQIEEPYSHLADPLTGLVVPSDVGEDWRQANYPLGAVISDFSEKDKERYDLTEAVVVDRLGSMVTFAPLTDFTYYVCKLSARGESWYVIDTAGGAY